MCIPIKISLTWEIGAQSLSDISGWTPRVPSQQQWLFQIKRKPLVRKVRIYSLYVVHRKLDGHINLLIRLWVDTGLQNKVAIWILQKLAIKYTQRRCCLFGIIPGNMYAFHDSKQISIYKINCFQKWPGNVGRRRPWAERRQRRSLSLGVKNFSNS